MRSALAALAVTLAATVVVPAPAPRATAAPASVAISAPAASLTRWDSAGEWRAGIRAGLRVRRGSLVLDGPTSRRTYRGTRYDVGTWTGPWRGADGGFTALIASWSATTPGDSWVEVRTQVADATRSSRWRVLGRWASGDTLVRRTSVPGQSDPLGRVATDTWQAATPAGASTYRLQVKVMRRTGAPTAPPVVDIVGAVASRVTAPGATSAPGRGAGVLLDVPGYSQMIHRGRLPQYGGGGEAWCSPTSLAMVLGYYGRLPGARATRWVADQPEPFVAEAARRTYDSAYAGTGNWSFNTAYAATRGLDGFVTRLRSLRDAEDLITAGIPVVVSVSFAAGQLSGAPISSTAGHLLVVVGFTATGDPIVNDPAGATNAEVRRTYDRAQLERAWLAGSGGTAYVVHDAAHPLPASTGAW